MTSGLARISDDRFSFGMVSQEYHVHLSILIFQSFSKLMTLWMFMMCHSFTLSNSVIPGASKSFRIRSILEGGKYKYLASFTQLALMCCLDTLTDNCFCKFSCQTKTILKHWLNFLNLYMGKGKIYVTGNTMSSCKPSYII